MHDPMTVAFHVPRPWPAGRLFRGGKGPWYWPSVVTVWHVDPCKGGDEDSCGWSFPTLTADDLKLAKDMFAWEKKFPYYFNRVARVYDPQFPNLKKIAPGDAAALCVNAFEHIAWSIHRKRLSPKLFMCAMQLGYNSSDNFQAAFASQDENSQERAFRYLIRSYRSATRSWWRHPKWHFWHWKVQVHFLQDLKRWLFSRCKYCGKGFSWGYAPASSSWDSDGPSWFNGEEGVYHFECAERRWQDKNEKQK